MGVIKEFGIIIFFTDANFCRLEEKLGWQVKRLEVTSGETLSLSQKFLLKWRRNSQFLDSTSRSCLQEKSIFELALTLMVHLTRPVNKTQYDYDSRHGNAESCCRCDRTYLGYEYVSEDMREVVRKLRKEGGIFFTNVWSLLRYMRLNHLHFNAFTNSFSEAEHLYRLLSCFVCLSLPHFLTLKGTDETLNFDGWNYTLLRLGDSYYVFRMLKLVILTLKTRN